MKKIFLITASLVLGLTFFSCKKEKLNPAPPPVVVDKPLKGTKWTGLYGTIGNTPNFYYKFNFFSNDSIEVNANREVNPDVAKGTWTIINDTLRSYYTYTTGDSYSIIAKWTSSATQITGTWGNGGDNSNGGTFILDKK